MATAFDPASLSAADQAAFTGWQQQLRSYVAANGGGVPAAVSYALAHPEYVQQHPELQGAVQLVSGATLPASTQTALKDFHPVWGSGGEGFAKNKGLFGNWETWLQLGLGGALGGVAAAGALGAGGAAAPAATSTAPAVVPPALTGPAAGGGLFGMSTPLLATTAIGAGTGIVNAIIQGNAAKSAAQTQAQAAQTAAQQQLAAIDKARAEATPLYQQAQDTIARNQAQGQAALAPYAAAGGQGLMALSSFLGVPQASPAAPAAAPAPTGTVPLSTVMSAQQQSANQFVPNAVANSPNPAVRALASPGGVAQAAADWPWLQAPDGTRRRVSPDQVAFYVARGAKQV